MVGPKLIGVAPLMATSMRLRSTVSHITACPHTTTNSTKMRLAHLRKLLKVNIKNISILNNNREYIKKTKKKKKLVR